MLEFPDAFFEVLLSTNLLMLVQHKKRGRHTVIDGCGGLRRYGQPSGCSANYPLNLTFLVVTSAMIGNPS
jgi:hypothetical protein